MSFIAVTHSIEPYWLWDFHDTGGKTCNFIIPLFVVDETPTALLIHGNTDSDDDDEWGDIFEVQYEVGLGEVRFQGSETLGNKYITNSAPFSLHLPAAHWQRSLPCDWKS